VSLLILLICSHGCFIEVCSIQLEVFSKPIVWNILVWVDYNTNKNLSRNLIIFMGTSGSKSFVDGFVQYGNETIFSMVLANVSHIFTCKYWNMNFFPLQFKYLNILWLTSHFCWYFFFFFGGSWHIIYYRVCFPHSISINCWSEYFPCSFNWKTSMIYMICILCIFFTCNTDRQDYYRICFTLS